MRAEYRRGSPGQTLPYHVVNVDGNRLAGLCGALVDAAERFPASGAPVCVECAARSLEAQAAELRATGETATGRMP